MKAMRILLLVAAFTATSGVPVDEYLKDHDGEGLIHRSLLGKYTFGAPKVIPDAQINKPNFMNLSQTHGRPGALQPGKDYAHCIQVGIVVDDAMINLIGNEAKTKEYFRSMLIEISKYYMKEWSAKLRLKEFIVYNSWNAAKTAESRLDKMQKLFVSGPLKDQKEKANLWVHASASNLDGGGIAWMEGLFSYKYMFGVTLGMEGPTTDENWAKWDLMVVAHEIGHLFGADHTHEIGIDDCGRKCSQDIPKKCDASSANPLADSGGFCGSIMSYCHTCSTGEGGMNNVVFDFHDKNKGIVDKLFTKYDVNYDLADAQCDSNSFSGDDGNSSGGGSGGGSSCKAQCDTDKKCDWADDGCGGWCSEKCAEDSNCQPACDETKGQCGWASDGCNGNCENPCPCQGTCVNKCQGMTDGCGNACSGQCPTQCKDTQGYRDIDNFGCYAWNVSWGFWCGSENDRLCNWGYTEAECDDIRQNCTKSCQLCGEAWVFGNDNGGPGPAPPPTPPPTKAPKPPTKAPSFMPKPKPTPPPTTAPGGGGGATDVDCSSFDGMKFKCENKTQDKCKFVANGKKCLDINSDSTDSDSTDDCAGKGKAMCNKMVSGKKPCRWDKSPLRADPPHFKGGCVKRAGWTKMCKSDATAQCKFQGKTGNVLKNACNAVGTKGCKYLAKKKNCILNKPNSYDKTC